MAIDPLAQSFDVEYKNTPKGFDALLSCQAAWELYHITKSLV